MTRPLILISNDDGFDAPGILALNEALRTFADTVVVAPETQQSAGGHGFTLHKPLRLVDHGDGVYACSGTPADCVYLALHYVVDRPPDLVASGINNGLNVATDVNYSGTIAAAREGHLTGARAIAFSQVHAEDADLEAAAARAAELARFVLGHDLPEDVFYNVNFPATLSDETPTRLTRLGTRDYHRDVVVKKDPRGRPYYWIGGSYIGYKDVPGTDGAAIHAGAVSMTPLHTEVTSETGYAALAALGIEP